VAKLALERHLGKPAFGIEKEGLGMTAIPLGRANHPFLDLAERKTFSMWKLLGQCGDPT
jgi:hypothetical protein